MVSCGLLLMYGIGAVLGPVLSSLAMNWLGSAGLFGFTGAVHLLLFIYLLQRRLRRETADTEEHVSFADALKASRTTSQVYETEMAGKNKASENP